LSVARAEAVRVPRLDPVVESVAKALRAARSRTGLSEQQVVALLAEQSFVTTAARLRGWERSGVIRIDVAARLADVYGTTIDALAGRGAYRARHHRRPDLYGPPAGP
jgi:transcriptional regulator with XRE-family HTH domain